MLYSKISPLFCFAHCESESLPIPASESIEQHEIPMTVPAGYKPTKLFYINGTGSFNAIVRLCMVYDDMIKICVTNVTDSEIVASVSVNVLCVKSFAI